VSREATTRKDTQAATHIPSRGSKQYVLLEALLRGVRVDPFIALMEWNLPSLNARVSELRKMGWPVRSIALPHPKLRDETITAYVLDAHFRRWMIANATQHPRDYPFHDLPAPDKALPAPDRPNSRTKD